MLKNRMMIVLALVFAINTACKNDIEKAKVSSSVATPEVVKAEPAASKPGGGLSGKVTETMEASGYTYVLLENGPDKTWVAGPKTSVKVGDVVNVADGSVMNNFESKSLKRTFEKIIFASAIIVNGTDKVASVSQAPENHTQAPASTSVDLKGIVKAKGGKSVAEVFASRGEMNGKNVLVRGKVVKAMSGIMGKNWLHVKDGTGGVGTDDLVVTTSATAKVGDKVLINGKLSSDKDFGSGYRYDAIVEDAEVTIE
ncbi:MAG: DNA-binding protein [Desulfobulbaceae bacterium]|nr:DNA-binding protein [Desulfobulbaceae bacterium]